MKRTRRILAAITCALVITGLGTIPVSAANYETKNFDVDMTVTADNTLLITQTIGVDFSQASHGIYQAIPYRGDMTYEYNGQVYTKPFFTKIKDISVEGFETDVSYEDDIVLIRIGSPDTTVSGPVEYQLKYKVAVYEDRIPELDQIYWNLIPTETEAGTEKAYFRIEMPKEFDESKVAFIAGAYGQADDGAVDWRLDGNIIYGETNRPLAANEGVTLRVELPEGYFTGVASNDWMNTVMLVLIFAAPLTALLLWFLFGRDKKIIPTVEFYPPDGVPSAELGYIMDGAVDDNDVVSMILYFADKGYLEIREEEEKSFLLIKKQELPPEAKTYEQTMFRGLFAKGDQVLLDELKEDFYETFTTVKELLAGEFTDKKGRKIYTKGSKIARVFSLLLMINPLLAVSVLGTGYRYLPGVFLLIALPLILIIFLALLWQIYLYDKKDNMKKTTRTGGQIASGLLTVAALVGFGCWAMFMDLLLQGVLAVVACGICFVCAAAMKQRTPYSVERMGRILGFKEFIRTAELPKLKLLVEETPDYFYSILPYAYVFGLSDKWAKNFEGIAVAPPSWYASGYNGDMFSTYVFLRAMNRCTRELHSNIAIPPMPQGGGIGGGGGGFSGGGFSGGGMGGGRMGSW